MRRRVKNTLGLLLLVMLASIGIGLGAAASHADCDDGLDDDGDGFVDYPVDPGCDSSADVSESNSSTVVFAHLGAIDPEDPSESWGTNGSGVGVVRGPVLDDQGSGIDAWQVTSDR